MVIETTLMPHNHATQCLVRAYLGVHPKIFANVEGLGRTHHLHRHGQVVAQLRHLARAWTTAVEDVRAHVLVR